MTKILLQWIKKIFSDTHALIVAKVLAPLLTVGSIYLFAENLWTQLKIIAQTPTPLWVSIVLAFLSGLLIYLIQRRAHSYQFQKNRNFSVQIGDFKWYTYWIAGDCYGLSSNPYCAKHDLQMYKKNGRFVCLGTDKTNCDLTISTRDSETSYKKARAIVEKKLRRKNLYIGSI